MFCCLELGVPGCSYPYPSLQPFACARTTVEVKSIRARAASCLALASQKARKDSLRNELTNRF